jgi:Tol biopolymer transport system component
VVSANESSQRRFGAVFNLIGGQETRLTYGSGAQLFPIWSPDGRRIVFGKSQPQDHGLYSVDVLRADPEKLLLKAAQFSVPMDWSRDGRFILFAQVDDKTKWDLWALPLAGDRKPLAVVHTEFNEGDGQF